MKMSRTICGFFLSYVMAIHLILSRMHMSNNTTSGPYVQDSQNIRGLAYLTQNRIPFSLYSLSKKDQIIPPNITKIWLTLKVFLGSELCHLLQLTH